MCNFGMSVPSSRPRFRTGRVSQASTVLHQLSLSGGLPVISRSWIARRRTCKRFKASTASDVYSRRFCCGRLQQYPKPRSMKGIKGLCGQRSSSGTQPGLASGPLADVTSTLTQDILERGYFSVNCLSLEEPRVRISNTRVCFTRISKSGPNLLKFLV